MPAVAALVRGLLVRPGPTRAVGLVRILLGLVVWSELADTYRLEHALDDWPHKLALSILTWMGSGGMVLGVASRASAALTGVAVLVAWQWLGELGGDDQFRRHHVYTLGVSSLLLALTPCGASFSLDRAWAVRDARAAGAAPPAEWGDLWATLLLQVQVAAMYFWAAWDKAFPTFPERMEAYFADAYFGADHPGPWFAALMKVAGYGSVALEVALPFGLWWPRTRAVALWAGVAFHLLIYEVLAVSTYTATMLALYVLFVDPRSVSRLVDDVVGPPPSG